MNNIYYKDIRERETIKIFNKLKKIFPELKKPEFTFPEYKTKCLGGVCYTNRIQINNYNFNNLDNLKNTILHEFSHYIINSNIFPDIKEKVWYYSYNKKISHSRYFYLVLNTLCKELNIYNKIPKQKVFLKEYNLSKKLYLDIFTVYSSID